MKGRMRALWFIGLVANSLLTGCISSPRGPLYAPEKQQPGRVSTGPNFWWGMGQSNFQNEDPGVTPGKADFFRTDWDVFADTGRVPPKGNGTGSWSHYEKDIKAMKKIGVTHARIGIEWARVEPKPGVWNHRALDRYARMINQLRSAGIEPVVTLWHFTMPDWLVNDFQRDRTRWLHPDFQAHWSQYVELVTRRFGKSVSIYVPQNEPNGDVNLGWIAGQWPPGVWLDLRGRARATTASIKAFRTAADIIRKNAPNAKIMAVESLNYFERFFPYDPTGAFYHASQRANFDHLDGVADKCDLIGVNYYYTEIASPLTAITMGKRSGPGITLLGWKIKPVGLRRQLNLVWQRYRKPIVVTENGIATTHDVKRVKYLVDHLIEMDRAKEQDGVDIRGYFAWTLADNYEWQYGYRGPFGFAKLNGARTDYILRPSAMVYKGIIESQQYAEQLRNEDVLPDNRGKIRERW